MPNIKKVKKITTYFVNYALNKFMLFFRNAIETPF